MPSKTPRQARFMRAVANNPSFARKVGVPTKVGKEFSIADKQKGTRSMMRPPVEPKVGQGSKRPKTPRKFAKGGGIDGCATKGRTKGRIVGMKRGGKC